MQTPEPKDAWRAFQAGKWQREIDVRSFIVSNVTPYTGGPEFLAPPSSKTLAVWAKLQSLLREDIK